MAYVDGFVVPVKTAAREEYRKISEAVARIYLEYGALRCVETWGEDVPPGEKTSFLSAVDLAPDETACFSWMEFADKAARDRAHDLVWKDPRMDEIMHRDIVAGDRMIFGGFEVLVDMT
ncbi:DUF1428 family protein [Rhodobacterales bacterium HKCCE3408]|nr:DUF1428 family protein [Rhodobacterales bacterium HKCCE3408]